MGIFDFLKDKKNQHQKEEETETLQSHNELPERKETVKDVVVSAKKPELPSLLIKDFKIHDDIKNLLWFGDGPLKNLTKEQMISDKDVFVLIGGTRLGFRYGLSIDEPSLIYVKAPVNKPNDESLIPRPPYFPKYKDLTPEQRWIYLKLLTNPYNADMDIGYVFILYYGLERHLLQGDFHSAFNVILKLRDVHKNKSFQSYSGNALILSALLQKKGEYIPLFIKSLDNEYEFIFSDNLLLMSYYSFNVPLFPKDIMRMAKTFEFTNTNYIKKNPDIFEKCLKALIKEKTGFEQIDLKNYITDVEFKKLKYGNTTIFCNSSIIGNTVPVPLLADNFKLKKEMNTLLETAHERVKTKLAEMRKGGTVDKAVVMSGKQVKKETVKLEPLDERLLREPQGMTLLEKHYFYEEQIHAFYKRRDEDPKYIDMTIAACEKQIAIAKDVAKKMLTGKKRFTLKTDTEMLAALKKDMKADLKTLQGTDEQKALLEQIDRLARGG